MLAGINRVPKTLASCRHNLKKALDVLRNLKGLRHETRLFSEESLLAAEDGVALELLEDLMRYSKKKGGGVKAS